MRQYRYRVRETVLGQVTDLKFSHRKPLALKDDAVMCEARAKDIAELLFAARRNIHANGENTAMRARYRILENRQHLR